ncbi:hypothetical protein PR048_011747, partial [Dryococelus australis]
MLSGAYYHPTQFSMNSFLVDLDIDLCKCDNTTTVIAGDFNVNIDDNTPASLMYKILSNYNCFSTLHTLTTRVTENTKSVIDHFLSNVTNENISICTINTAISDHHVILLAIACKVSSLKNSTNEVTTKIDYDSTNEIVKTIVNVLSKVIIESSSIKSRDTLFKKFEKKRHNNHIREQLNLLNNTITTLKINLIANHHFKVFSNCNGNNKLLWRKINNTLGTNQKQGTKFKSVFDKH